MTSSQRVQYGKGMGKLLDSIETWQALPQPGDQGEHLQ